MKNIILWDIAPSVDFQGAAWRYIPEDRTLQFQLNFISERNTEELYKGRNLVLVRIRIEQSFNLYQTQIELNQIPS
jgi:hypothetical protein